MPTNNEAAARQEAIQKHYLRPRDAGYKTTPGQARNVIGVGIGQRMKLGKPVNERCVRFYVEKKIPLEAVDEPFRIPKMLAGGFPTDVVEARRFVSFDHEIAPGASISVDYNAPNIPASLARHVGRHCEGGECLVRPRIKPRHGHEWACSHFEADHVQSAREVRRQSQ